MDPNAFAAAYGLSTVAGIRPFATLALASLALRLGWIHLAHAYAGLGTTGATVLFAALALVELLGDKVPAVDHVLHLAHFAIKPVAAALLVGATLPAGVSGPVAAGGMAAAAANALLLHSGLTAVRGGSSAMTLGLANPVVSLGEDAVAAILLALSFVAPVVAAVLALAVTALLLWLAARVLREIAKRRRTSVRARAARP